MTKKNIKSSICILVLLITYSSFGQNQKIQNFVTKTFFGHDIMKKPDKIESESYRPIDYGERYDEKNIIKFKSHPLAKDVIEGEYNVTYLYKEKDLFENYGVYKLDMTLVFKNYKSAKEMLEKLKRLCKETSEFTYEKIGRENAPKSEEWIYDFDTKLQIPRVILTYSRGPHTIRIEVYTSYNFNNFKKIPYKLW